MAEYQEKGRVALTSSALPAQHTYGPSLRLLEENERFEGCYLIRAVTKAVTQYGEPYLRLALADISGKLNAYVWDLNQVEGMSLEPGCYVYVEAHTRRLRPMLVASIQSIHLFEAAPTLPASTQKASQS